MKNSPQSKSPSRLHEIEIIERKRIVDTRGSFLKVITGYENRLDQRLGEAYFVLGHPGQLRASHYHKLATEWFTLIVGRALLSLICIETNKRREIYLDAESPVTVRVPPTVVHIIRNCGSEDFILFAYSDLRYNESDTIAFEDK